MPRLVDISIRVRIFAAFGLVLLVTLALGGFGLAQLSTISRAADVVAGNSLPSVVGSNGILKGVLNYRRHQAAMLLNTDPEVIAERKELLASQITEIAAGRQAYEALITSEREAFGKFDRAWARFLPMAAEIETLLRDGKRAELLAIYNGPSRIAIEEAITALEEAVGINERDGKDAGVMIVNATGSAMAGTIIALIIAAGLAVAAGLTTVATVAGPTLRLTDTMNRLSRRELTAAVDGTDRKDEIGAMARAVQVFKDGLIEAERLSAAQKAEEKAKAARAARVDSLVQAFDGTSSESLRAVSAAATELDATAQSMAAIAEETSRQATSAASAAEQTTANVQTVAAATEEMASSIQEINRQVNRAKGVAQRAAQSVQETNVTVEGLTAATQKIGEVVTLIQAIAAQTNLLALNATIEAARAGEAGKGFAVVASEVKNLAGQTAKATEEIAAQISAVQKVSAETSTAIQAIGTIIEEVNGISATIAAAMEQQGASTNEISRNVTQAAAGTQEVSANIGQVTQVTGQAGAAATQVLGAAGDLARQSESLKQEVERFLAAIKAA
ncbi:methyl-accepting chemotaxis protein, putative [Rhodospirillum centenum SW]|uniref:Methyl-accepting chemotaxis protein, putative n=2 Tax=Rhodospirillum centenum TaxID=34018 RepID=B6IVV9_RHOCS|nr:methyl-accepting chemotaxis protein, putative [Rhodospirillum centenum SW]